MFGYRSRPTLDSIPHNDALKPSNYSFIGFYPAESAQLGRAELITAKFTGGNPTKPAIAGNQVILRWTNSNVKDGLASWRGPTACHLAYAAHSAA